MGATGGAGTPLVAGTGMGMWEEEEEPGGGTGAVILIESCEPNEVREWAEFKEAEELCKLGRR